MKQLPDSPHAHADTRAWPPISVVMPILNEERHLQEAVDMILSQRYP
ncbi:glycosyltransferase family 2 protein, partial [Nonomuraea sp. NPDC055795]